MTKKASRFAGLFCQKEGDQSTINTMSNIMSNKSALFFSQPLLSNWRNLLANRIQLSNRFGEIAGCWSGRATFLSLSLFVLAGVEICFDLKTNLVRSLETSF